MQLKRKQKTAVLEWIAEGLDSGEIDKLAREFMQPFTITRQQVDYYRKTRKFDLKVIAQLTDAQALTEGYARRENRIRKLSVLAAMMERDLFNGLLWCQDIKSIGPALASRFIEFAEFNKTEVDAYRGVLDDIAREVGGRVNKVEGLLTDDLTVWQKLMSPRGEDGNFDQPGTDEWGRQTEEGDETDPK